MKRFKRDENRGSKNRTESKKRKRSEEGRGELYNNNKKKKAVPHAYHSAGFCMATKLLLEERAKSSGLPI
jgi:hypothetical protein